MTAHGKNRKKGGTLPLGTPAPVVTPRARSGTLPLGTPAPVLPTPREHAEPEEQRPHERPGVLIDAEGEPVSEDRAVHLLPPELPKEEVTARSLRSTALADEATKKAKPVSLPPGGSLPPGASLHPSYPSDSPRRSRLSSWAGVGQRTSLTEIAGRADVITRLPEEQLRRIRIGYRLTALTIGVALLILIVAIGAASHQWRIIPIGILFLLLTAVITYAVVRALLPRLARRFGEVQLPGRAGMYIAMLTSAAVSLGGVLTWGAATGGVVFVQTVLPILAPAKPELQTTALAATPEPEPKEPPHEPVALPPWDGYAWVSPGRLFLPASFRTTDGEFDLVLHFHGHPELVRDSVNEANLSALVHVTTFDGSRAYEGRFSRPNALEDLIAKIEARASSRAGFEMKARRVALTSWSAGYGAIGVLLSDPKVVERVDSVIVLDGIHGALLPGTRTAHPSVVAPFAEFARKAIAGEKLMMITHSAINTADYCSSTESADALLATLGLQRTNVDPATSPLPPAFKTAVDAFPESERRWLTMQTVAHEGNFYLYGCTGIGMGDHIAHLAQMSVTVLPELEKRWH